MGARRDEVNRSWSSEEGASSRARTHQFLGIMEIYSDGCQGKSLGGGCSHLECSASVTALCIKAVTEAPHSKIDPCHFSLCAFFSSFSKSLARVRLFGRNGWASCPARWASVRLPSLRACSPTWSSQRRRFSR